MVPSAGDGLRCCLTPMLPASDSPQARRRRRARLSRAPRRLRPPWARALPTNQIPGRPLAPALPNRSERGLASLATRSANQFSRPTEGVGLKGGEIRIKGWGDPDFSTNQKEAPESRGSVGTRPLASLWKPREAKEAATRGAGARS